MKSAAAMAEPPEDRRLSSISSGEVPERIDREDFGENGGDEKEVKSGEDVAGNRLEQAKSGEASAGDAPVNNGGSNSQGLVS